MSERSDAATIGHLSVRWREDPREAHTPAAHLRVERWVNQADLVPAGLRSGEILVVNRLAGLPALANTARARLDWQRALQRHMTDLYRSAARPENGRVPPGAASVVFADGAELLLCLVRDTLANRAAAQWTWQRLLPTRALATPGVLLATGFTRHVEALPAAVSQLTPRELVQLGARLRPPDVGPVLRALHERFALPEPALARWVESPAVPPASSEIPGSGADSAAVDTMAPWSSWLPDELARSMPSTSAVLLGVSLALYHAPARARTPGFGQAVAAWMAATERLMTETAARPEPAPAVASELAAEIAPPAAAVEAQPESALADGTEPHAVPRPAIAPDGIRTDLGGVLYLINLLAWLDLPHGWSEDFAAHVGAWALVEALARGLLGDAYADDPLWDVLAELDRRAAGTPAAADMPVPDAFRMPPGWLARVGAPQEPWLAYHAAGRIALVDATTGYALIDVPLGDLSPEERLRSELAPYHAAGHTVRWQWAEGWPDGPLTPGTMEALGPGLSWWLARVLGCVRTLLERALGPDMTPQIMLCEPGRVATSRTHVDLFLPLDRIRLPVRRAGLDQDPGWVPDLGHIVLFHFL